MKSRYSQGDLLQILDLQQEVSTIRQDDSSITYYFTKLRMIWDELENYRPNPICTCATKWSCDAFTSVMERIPQDQVMQFLRGLNDQYSNVRSNILMMDPLPPIPKVFSYVVQQERQVLNSSLIRNLNFEVKGSTINVASSGPTPICSYCGGVKHTIDVWYQTNGFPSSRGRKGCRVSYGRGTKMCSYYGKSGHTIEECY